MQEVSEKLTELKLRSTDRFTLIEDHLFYEFLNDQIDDEIYKIDHSKTKNYIPLDKT